MPPTVVIATIDTSAWSSGYVPESATTTPVSAACADPNCLQCIDNKCAFCSPKADLYLSNGRCLAQKENPQVLTVFDQGTATAIVEFSPQRSVTDDWQAGLEFVLLDIANNKSYSDPKHFDFATGDSSFTIKVDLDTQINYATLLVLKNASSASIPDDLFPIRFEPFRYIRQELGRQIGSSLDSLDKARLAANVVLAPVSLNGAVILDRLLSDFKYQALLAAPAPSFFGLLLQPAIKISLLPFRMPGTNEQNEGILEQKTKYYGCRREKVYLKYQVRCSILENYNDDFVPLVLVLLGTSLMSLAGLGLRKLGVLEDKRPDPGVHATLASKAKHRLNRLGCLLTVKLGVSFFGLKMASNSMKLLLFALLNLYKTDASWQMLVGLFVSVVVLAYYLAYGGLTLLFARRLSEEIIKQRKAREDRGVLRDCALEDLVDFKRLPHGLVGEQFREMRSGLPALALYFPLAVLARDLLIAFFIVVLQQASSAAPFLVFLVEAGLVVFAVHARARTTRLEAALEIGLAVLRMTFAAMAAATFYYPRIPESLDWAMFYVLILSTAGCFACLLYILILTIYDAVYVHWQKLVASGRFKDHEAFVRGKLDDVIKTYRDQVLTTLRTNPRGLARRLDIDLGQSADTIVVRVLRQSDYGLPASHLQLADSATGPGMQQPSVEDPETRLMESHKADMQASLITPEEGLEP